MVIFCTTFIWYEVCGQMSLAVGGIILMVINSKNWIGAISYFGTLLFSFLIGVITMAVHYSIFLQFDTSFRAFSIAEFVMESS